MIESLNRPVNLIKAGYSYIKGSATGSTEINAMPVSISTELTNNCNLKCPECPSGSGMTGRKRGFMDIDLFKKIMKELKPYLYNVNLYFQGEPMLHPLFFSFLANCLIPNSIVSTNGHFLSEENSELIVLSGLKKLIISLDGLDQETYSLYRVNGDMNRVISGLTNVTRAKMKHNSSLKVELQFLVNRFNEHQIEGVKRIAKSLHTSLKLKSMQIVNNKNIPSWMPSESKFRRYKYKEGEYIIKNSLPDRCARIWFTPVITWDGKVVPCCFDKDTEYAMGDLNQDSFSEIWNGPKYRIFRKSILSGRHMIEMCRNCTSGLRGVKY